MNSSHILSLSLAVAMSLLTAGGLASVDLPISTVSNKMYLASISERPWWNDAWAKRMPILVSGQTEEKDDKVVVDTIIDFGEPVRPEEIRVVTPWETLCDAVAERVQESGIRNQGAGATSLKPGETALRLLFKTSLREHQNRPFLVYYGNPEATAQKIFNDVTLDADDDTFRIRNGAVDVTFDRNHVTDGLIRKLRIPGSSCDTVLFDRETGYAKEGFVFRPNANNGWDKGEVIMDNPLAKSVRFSCADANVTFTVYSEQPRVDWKYELKRGAEANIRMNWAPGNGTAFDDFFYCGRSGNILTQRAGLDFVTDCIKNPEGRFENWLGEGWYAFGERRSSDIAGLIFDHRAVHTLEYTSYYGFSTWVRFVHQLKQGEYASGSGAVVAMLGNVDEFRRVYRRMAKPMAILVGDPQLKVDKPYRIPRLDHDWCFDIDVGWGFAGSSGTADPLMKDPAWANRIANRMRSYGCTAFCLCGYPWWNMPIHDKTLYDRLLAAQQSDSFESHIRKRKLPSFVEVQKTGTELAEMIKAVHGKGLGVHTWTEPVPGWSMANEGYSDPEVNDLNVEMSSIRVSMGQDCAYSMVHYGEGVYLPRALTAKNGSEHYFNWENPQEAFDEFNHRNELVKAFYTKFKSRNPDIPVFLWSSENGEYAREKFASENEGFFDSIEVEMLPHAGFGHTKHVAKRMRSHFNNAVGHTVWHHYYIMKPKPEERMWQVEWPFIFGVNGFSQENITYELTDTEIFELTADFFRFAEYTKLGEKVARMAPVKNLGVYRDPKMFRDDVLRKRLGTPYRDNSRQDGRVRSFSELKNFSYDVIGPKYFTAKDIAQYRVVYVPEDEVMDETEANALHAYVEAGGGAIIEGKLSPAVKAEFGELADARIQTVGNGKVLYYATVRTDAIAKRDGKIMNEVRKAVVDLGGIEPYTLTGSAALDGNLQAGPDGMFLGLYNSANDSQSGVVSIDYSTIQPFNCSTSLYVLDVKRGIRTPLTNGTFAVTIDRLDTGYYLIGDDSFTSVPKATMAESLGPVAYAEHSQPLQRTVVDISGFKPAVSVEFVKADKDGNPIPLSRSTETLLDVRSFTAQSFTAKDFRSALTDAGMVHFVFATAEATDPVFQECAAELKALLERGGTILFTHTPTGDAARKFLAEIDVLDPNPSAQAGVGGGWASWCGPTDHPFVTSCHRAPVEQPSPTGSQEWWAWRHICNNFQYSRVFTKWDNAKQRALFKPQNVDGDYSPFIVQENVLGNGRIIFNENDRTFNDWYENKWFGDNLYAWIFGIDIKEHVEKAVEIKGGIGNVWTK